MSIALNYSRKEQLLMEIGKILEIRACFERLVTDVAGSSFLISTLHMKYCRYKIILRTICKFLHLMNNIAGLITISV
jgi:hypothetical protein